MIDLSQAYDRTNINTLFTKLKQSELPDQITNIIEYMCGNTFVNTVYSGEPSEFCPVGNGTRQGGITSGILLNFYIIEVSDTFMNLPVSCSLNCTQMNILSYADDIVLLAPLTHSLQVMFDTLSDTIHTLLLEINVHKSCHNGFRYKIRK